MRRKLLVSTVGSADSPVFQQLHAQAEVRADAIGFDFEWRPNAHGDPARVLVEGAYAAIVDTEPYDATTLEEIASCTKLLVRFGVGHDSVDLDAAARLGIKVGRTPGGNARAVAEMALLLALAARRHLIEQAETVRSGEFESSVTLGLSGATVGLVGYGAVARELRALLSGFDCNVIVYAPRLADADAQADGIERVALEELFQRSDVVSVHVPATSETQHLVSSSLLRSMKPSATLVNTARGAVIDEDALIEALHSGWIGSAGLDVFTDEPLPSDSPLLQAPNLVVSPHTASQTEQALRTMFAMALDVVEDVALTGRNRHLLTT